jgi:hypothetical protein
MASYSKNLLHVQNHLDAGEKILFSVDGVYEKKILDKDSVKSGILLATEKRVVFFAKSMFGFDFEAFPYKSISSIEKSKALMGHSITLFASGNKVRLKWINKGNIEEFVSFVNENIGGTNSGAAQVSDDIPAQIKKLSDLFVQGILTEEEFSTKKAELLSKM